MSDQLFGEHELEIVFGMLDTVQRKCGYTDCQFESILRSYLDGPKARERRIKLAAKKRRLRNKDE